MGDRNEGLSNAELSDEMLEAVSGGTDWPDWQEAYREYLAGGGELDFWHWIPTLA